MNDGEYAARLGEILRGRNTSSLKRFLLDQARRFGDERQVDEVEERTAAEMEELMHRMIVARPDLSDLHRASKQWLAARV
ncbi:MAG: hypothetical protein U0821_21830 [Chloroflexota bacterium]